MSLLVAEWLADFIVTVSNSSFPVYAYQLVPPMFVHCGQFLGIPGPGETQPIRGCHVFISIPAVTPLQLCEVEVYENMFLRDDKILPKWLLNIFIWTVYTMNINVLLAKGRLELNKMIQFHWILSTCQPCHLIIALLFHKCFIVYDECINKLYTVIFLHIHIATVWILYVWKPNTHICILVELSV